jgi:hypothetical protein
MKVVVVNTFAGASASFSTQASTRDSRLEGYQKYHYQRLHQCGFGKEIDVSRMISFKQGINSRNVDPRTFEPLPATNAIPAHGQEHRTTINQTSPVHRERSKVFSFHSWEAKSRRDDQPPDACNRI